ncbi:GtrA family protein [Pseudomonas sp. dw_358]|uniref:GtrA family protein n=1 Tax=Pseudomonas sp. dw_358 TaxID=2720083 RepID=UPI001BD53ADA|nr:GtrA family protein [Pseudomonas sp. dw_358]
MSRWRSESLYLGRYVGSGAANTVVGFAVIFIAMGAGLSPLVANMCGYAVGFVLGFVLSKKVVFRSEGAFVKESIRYLIAFIIAFLLNVFVLHLAITLVGLPPVIAQIVAAVVYTAVMYLLTRFYVFAPSHRIS